MAYKWGLLTYLLNGMILQATHPNYLLNMWVPAELRNHSRPVWMFVAGWIQCSLPKDEQHVWPRRKCFSVQKKGGFKIHIFSERWTLGIDDVFLGLTRWKIRKDSKNNRWVEFLLIDELPIGFKVPFQAFQSFGVDVGFPCLWLWLGSRHRFPKIFQTCWEWYLEVQDT